MSAAGDLPLDDLPFESPSTDPPPDTLRWIEGRFGASVVEVEELVGGLSSAVHRICFDDGRPAVILRRYTLASWLEHEPNIPFDEARNLGMLSARELGVAAPRLLAADPDGIRGDVPAIVMSEVPGRPDIAPVDPVHWAEQLAECLAGIHREAPIHGLPDYRRWDRPDRPPPVWTEHPGWWQQAVDRARGDLPEHPHVFLHRDFHPNNIHWLDGAICAVVDWLGACNGPVAGDLAHCRWNIAVLVDPATADRFTEHYRTTTGYSEDLLEYDLSTVLSGPVGPFPTHAWNALGRTDLTPDVVGQRVDAWLGHLLDHQ